ncbi:retina and anterior neural fold homeobox protein 2 isoform 1-T2 [Morphnus guianensis]
MSDGSREAAFAAIPAQRCPFLGRIAETPAAKARASWGQSLEDGDHGVAGADVPQPDLAGVPPSTPRDIRDPGQDEVGGGGGMGGGGPGPRNPILQGPVLPSCYRIASAWLFCCSSLHSCSRARVCSASRGFLASLAFRGGQAGGTMGAAPSSGPDLHHRSSSLSPPIAPPLLSSRLPHLVPSPTPPRRPVSAVPPPVPISPIPTAPHAPNPHPAPGPPPLPCGAAEHGWVGQAGDPGGVLGPPGGPCPWRGLWVLTPSPLSLQVQSCANEKRVSESGMVAADPIPSLCPQPQDTPRCSHGDNRAPAPPSTHSPLPQGTPGCSTQHPCPSWRLPLGHPKTAAPPCGSRARPGASQSPWGLQHTPRGAVGRLGGASSS